MHLPENLPPFLNIHTHRKPSLLDEFAIRNAYVYLPKSLAHLNYFLSLGVHPWFAGKINTGNLSILQKAAKTSSCLAIGECGVDRVNGPDLNTQFEAFSFQIGLANQLKKPLILHLVKSYSDILQHAQNIEVPWIVHGFRGNQQQATALIDCGARLSFGTTLLKDANLQALVATIPINKLYLETDNSTELINTMYQATATYRKLQVDTLRKAIWTNFENDFKFTYDR